MTLNGIYSGRLTTKADAVNDIATRTRSALPKPALDKWIAALLEPLRLELNKRGFRTKTVDDFANELRDILDGLNYLAAKRRAA
jgi:hypothetical protein